LICLKPLIFSIIYFTQIKKKLQLSFFWQVLITQYHDNSMIKCYCHRWIACYLVGFKLIKWEHRKRVILCTVQIQWIESLTKINLILQGLLCFLFHPLFWMAYNLVKFVGICYMFVVKYTVNFHCQYRAGICIVCCCSAYGQI
jgi:hypothetical protein